MSSRRTRIAGRKENPEPARLGRDGSPGAAEASPVTTGPSGPVLQLRVTPRSGRSTIAGIKNGAILVRVAAAPVEGAANDAVIALLAPILGVPARALQLLSGPRSRDKRVVVSGLTSTQALERLRRAMAP